MKKDQLHQLLRSIPQPDTPEGNARIRELLLANGVDTTSLYQSMEMSSLFVDAHMDISFPGDVISPHDHNFHEMVYCLSGGVDYLIGGQQYHLQRGDILCVPAGMTHAPLIPQQLTEPYRRYVLWISQEYFQILNSMFLGDSLHTRDLPRLIRASGSSGEFLSQYFRRCVQECEQKQYRYDGVVFGIVTELVVQLARLLRTEQSAPAGKPGLLEQIISHVDAHLAERITVADVAARFWVSQSTVSQLFRKKMGTSFYRYVTQRRLLESKLLIKSGVPMEQVSVAVGFQDYSTFYRAFKSEFNISPTQYRKQIN